MSSETCSDSTKPHIEQGAEPVVFSIHDLHVYGCPNCGSSKVVPYFSCGNTCVCFCEECQKDVSVVTDGDCSCLEYREETSSEGVHPFPSRHPLAP